MIRETKERQKRQGDPKNGSPLAANERYNVRAQEAKAASKRTTGSVASFLGM